MSGESFAEIPNVGFPFEGSDGKGRECVRRRPRRKTRSRKGPFPPFFPEDGCVYGMRGADGGDVGGGARPGGRGAPLPKTLMAGSTPGGFCFQPSRRCVLCR